MNRVSGSALLVALFVTAANCQAQQPQSLMTTLAPWIYPGATIHGSTMADGETVDRNGDRTVQSLQYRSQMTTEDSVDDVIEHYREELKPDKQPQADAKEKATSGTSVVIHDDSEGRPFLIHVIIVNGDNTSTTIVISRGESESKTHIDWKRYLRF